MQPSETNPFAAPSQQHGGAIPFDGSPEEALALRKAGLNRETTLRALGYLKFASGLGALLAAGYTVVADRVVLQNWVRDYYWPPQPVWMLLLFVVAGLPSLIIAYGLWQLQPWARWLQAASSGVMVLVALYGIALGTTFSLEAAIGAMLGCMLLGTVHAILLLIVLSRPSGHVCSEEYALVRAATPALDKGRVWPKVCLFVVIWLAGFAGLGILVAIATA